MEIADYENTLEYLAALKREVMNSEKGLEYKGRIQNLADQVARLAQTEKENKEKDVQLAEMKSQVKMLKEKLGKETIPLSTLVEGVKRFAELKGIKEGKDMLEHLTYVLKKVPVWIDNVEPLENFFIAAESEEKKLRTGTVNYNDIHDNQNVPVGK